MTTSNGTAQAIENERSKAGFVFTEAISPGVDMYMDLKRIYVSTHSEFQKISIIETVFGKTLVTDGKTQSSQIDEHIYHESLVHPSLIKAGLNGHKNQLPKTVFIGGGGELATAREVLRHKSVEKVVMVDLDGKVVEVCKEYLEEWGGEIVASNPRLELIIGDAYAYLINCKDALFDVIIMDISDPIEAGPGIMLYTQEFYQHARTLLKPNGVFVTQAGTAEVICTQAIAPGAYNDYTCHAPIKNTLETVFNCVLPYSVNIPSYGSDWGFVMAYDSSNPKDESDDYVNIDPSIIDNVVDSCIGDFKDIQSNAKNGNDLLKYYDGISHSRMFHLPKPIRQRMVKDERVMTRDNPVFMY